MSSLPETSLQFLGLVEILQELEDGRKLFKCAYLIESSPCGNRAFRSSAQKHHLRPFEDLLDLLNAYSGCDLPRDAALVVITALLEVCLCKRRHRSNVGEAQASQWMKELSDDVKRLHLHKKLGIYLLTQKEKRPTPSTPTPPSPSSTVFHTPPQSPILPPTLAPVPQKLPPSPPMTPPSLFIPYHESLVSISNSKAKAKAKRQRDTALEVTKLLQDPLLESDKPPGYIYLFPHPSPHEKNLFQVGFSEKSPKKRLDQHEKCYEGLERAQIRHEFIPFARRIEQVLLTEFRQERCKLKEPCHECKRIHGEWIRTQEEIIVKSWNKWIDFANEIPAPYEDGELRLELELPSPALTYRTPNSSQRKKSIGKQIVASRSPESTPSKTKGSRGLNGGRSQVSSPSSIKIDDSESSLIQGVSKLVLNPRDGGTVKKGKAVGKEV